ncbi:Ger(x)C family spore germination protein [Paenibacillus sp. BC26]|uniref:Ger(x)C family spore germination protein n=1 Tax=Paenibacillus sp. BC26 TaxID=1881032 RepID=UPI0008E4D5AC|nr:Ger(x)C family spore germination protein [Paenibacillus sp. BC26]SFS86261.1 germination protein, Ger(x)C family [Paenibacillus sp. BC26]
MKRTVLLLTWMLIVLTVSGCSYHNELKNLQLIYATSLDLNDKNEIVTTVTIQSPGGKERSAPTHEVISASGATMEESLYKKIGVQLAGPVATSKNQVMLISDKLARQDMAALLDATFRSSADPMLSMVAIVQGKASDLIRLERFGSATAGEYLRKLIISARYETAIPDVTLHSVFPIFFDPGQDSVLPIMKKVGSRAEIDGVALMNNRKYTGYHLNENQSMMLLLLSDKLEGICIMTRNFEDGEKHSPGDFISYISFDIVKLKRSKHVSVNAKGNVTVQLNLSLKASVIEYGKDDLADKKVIADLNKRLSAMLTAEAEQVTKVLRRANSDALGIGRDLIAFHPAYWKSVDWEAVYSKTDFQTKVDVEIISKGIKN